MALAKSAARFFSSSWGWIKAHRKDLDVLLPLLAAVLIVDILTFAAGFGGNDDFGTYTAQAWAILERGELAHYTYWYDHPPLGWMQIAGYAWLTNGFERADIDVLMSSELMVIFQLGSCVLIYALMRRFAFNRFFAGLAVALFALSPLSVQFQKLAFLDNIAVFWLLASMVLAASKRQRVWAAVGSAVCLGIATLTKETAAIWLIVVVYMLWQNHAMGMNGVSDEERAARKGTRVWSIVLFGAVYFSLGFQYILFALLKGELFPGEGHVSLLDALLWQLGRDGTYETIKTWLEFDTIFLAFTIIAILPAFFVRRLRPIVVMYVVMCLMLARGGYIPAPYVIGMLPFAALLVAGVLGSLWGKRENLLEGFKKHAFRMRRLTAAALVAAVGAFAAPAWGASIQDTVPRDEVYYYQATIDWIVENVPKDAVIGVDDNMWTDLKALGYENVVWFYKLDLDPAVKEQYVANGYKGIDYLVLKRFYWNIAASSAASVVLEAKAKGQQVAEFGNTNGAAGRIVDPYDVIRVA